MPSRGRQNGNGVNFDAGARLENEGRQSVKVESPVPESTVSVPISAVKHLNEYEKIALQVREDLVGLNSKLEDQIDGFLPLVRLTPEKLKARVDIGNDLLRILITKFPDCQMFPYGLDYLGIATDLDAMNITVDPFGKSVINTNNFTKHKVEQSFKLTFLIMFQESLLRKRLRFSAILNLKLQLVKQFLNF